MSQDILAPSELVSRWSALLPHADERQVEALGAELLHRWGEEHRDYHGIHHLVSGLGALDALTPPDAPRDCPAGGRLERLAYWFHDAVHRHDPPRDEQASAQLARDRLTGLLPAAEVDEVARLVLLTINHDPRSYDAPGQRVCDADLASLALDPEGYAASVESLRRERPDLSEPEWEAARIRRTGLLLARATLFTSPVGRGWEATARTNLADERRRLLAGAPPTRPHHEEPRA